MKKKLMLSLLLVLTLLFVLPGTACAEEPISLGSFTAGSKLDISVLRTDTDTEVLADGLPPGLSLEREEFSDGSLLLLRGTPLYAGDVHFTVDAGELFDFTLSILPAEPSVTVPADLSCRPGEAVELRASASAPDDGLLSYQWYIARGPVNEAIEGATGTVLLPDTSEPGTSWYCCEVINTNNGYTASAISDYVGVTVNARAIQNIAIESLPVKTDYNVGDSLDVTGLRVLVRYEGGYNEIIDEGFTVSPASFSSAGTHSVTVAYEGYRCGFSVTVKAAEESVKGIGVLTLPRKTEYAPGDALQTEGLSIRCYTENGGYFDVSSEDLECSPNRLVTAGEQTVTVRYAGKTCSFKVQVKEEKVVTGISVVTMPTVRSYTVGDRLDTAGLSIQVNSNQGSELLTEGYTVTPKVLATPGTQEITVLYGQFRTKFNVTVKARESVTPTPRPTPSPAATSAPTPAPETSAGPDASPSPEQTAQPVQTPTARKNTGVNTGVKIIFAIAVLALAGLAAYVWYLRRQGFEYDETDEPDNQEELDTVSGEPVDDGKHDPDSQ